MIERKRPTLRAVESGPATAFTVPLSTYLPMKKDAIKYKRRCARLMLLNRRLLLLPENWRVGLNVSDEFEGALETALDASDYDFGVFVARWLGGSVSV